MQIHSLGLLFVGLLMVLELNLIGSVHAHDGKAIVPSHERERAAQQAAAGPTQNQGVEAVTVLGAIDLSGEFASPDQRQLRAREIVILPGGVVAVHRHDARPGMAYILEGEIYEHRSDHPQPQLRKAGMVSFEKTGLTHWWENKSANKVRALVVDIVPGGTK